jgi:hypothetical protein
MAFEWRKGVLSLQCVVRFDFVDVVKNLPRGTSGPGAWFGSAWPQLEEGSVRCWRDLRSAFATRQRRVSARMATAALSDTTTTAHRVDTGLTGQGTVDLRAI